MNFFSGNMQDRTFVFKYMVGHIEACDYPQKYQTSYFSVKYCNFYEKWFIYQKPL